MRLKPFYPGIKGIRSRNNWLEAIPAQLPSEGDTILEAARRTSDILGLTGFSLVAVSWEKVTNQGRKGAKVITPHFPVLEGEKLLISPILQGRLVAEDWGPILAPSLIFYRKLKERFSGSYRHY